MQSSEESVANVVKLLKNSDIFEYMQKQYIDILDISCQY